MRKILVLIDYQRDFTTGSLASAEAVKLLNNIKEKISEALKDKREIFITYDVHNENYLNTQEGLKLPVPHCLEGSEGAELYGDLENLLKNKKRIFKIKKNQFGSLQLPEVIKSASLQIPDEIEICGVVTEICVISNAAILKAAFPEAKITIDASCCSGISKDAHYKALDVMESMQIEVVRRKSNVKTPEIILEEMKEWIKRIKKETRCNGFAVGISGGKDSSVTAALLVESVGRNNVLGVLMPNGIQPDIEYSKDLCEYLQIPNITVNIEEAYKGILKAFGTPLNEASKINMAPRLRMTALYAAAQNRGYLVCGTGNLSEKYIGYFTKWGDGAFDLNVIGNLTTEEVIALGDALGLPEKFTRKTPSDGLSGKTDEEKIGFSYKILNEYIKTGVCQDEQIKAKIDAMHAAGRHKIIPPPVFEL